MLFLRVFCGVIVAAVIVGWIFLTGWLHGRALKIIGNREEPYGRVVLWGQVLPFGMLASLAPFAATTEYLVVRLDIAQLWAVVLLSSMLASLMWNCCDTNVKKKKWQWYHDCACVIETILLALAIGTFVAAANVAIGFPFMVPFLMLLITWGVLMDCNAMFTRLWEEE